MNLYTKPLFYTGEIFSMKRFRTVKSRIFAYIVAFYITIILINIHAFFSPPEYVEYFDASISTVAGEQNRCISLSGSLLSHDFGGKDYDVEGKVFFDDPNINSIIKTEVKEFDRFEYGAEDAVFDVCISTGQDTLPGSYPGRVEIYVPYTGEPSYVTLLVNVSASPK
ncbi:MAG: hypothetical protein VKK04_10860 [Synechococcales bacterium]|nr:hypothetical protein [Synechococcales bacterium]